MSSLVFQHSASKPVSAIVLVVSIAGRRPDCYARGRDSYCETEAGKVTSRLAHIMLNKCRKFLPFILQRSHVGEGSQASVLVPTVPGPWMYWSGLAGCKVQLSASLNLD